LSAPNILALDLSLTATGWCLGGETGRITTKKRGWERIHTITYAIDGLRTQASLVVLEGYSFGSRGNATFQIAELGGIVRNDLWRAGAPFVDVAPAALKKYATGKGNCGKDAMIAAAIRRFGFAGSDNNEADAYLLWCMAMHAYGRRVGVGSLPVVQGQALAKVEWPAIGGRPLAKSAPTGT
jgi:Holliday junction resolvasome RuvABC endonuclease subunit